MTDWRSGAWRPAVFTKRRHFVPAGSPTRPYGRFTLGSGLCGCPGYLEDDVRGFDWTQWKLCQYCLPAWLNPWPPPGYQPTSQVTARLPELGQLDGWWWRSFGVGGTPPVHGYRLRETGIDCLRIDSPESAALQRLDLAGKLRDSASGPLDYLVSLLG